MAKNSTVFLNSYALAEGVEAQGRALCKDWNATHKSQDTFLGAVSAAGHELAESFNMAAGRLSDGQKAETLQAWRDARETVALPDCSLEGAPSTWKLSDRSLETLFSSAARAARKYPANALEGPGGIKRALDNEGINSLAALKRATDQAWKPDARALVSMSKSMRSLGWGWEAIRSHVGDAPMPEATAHEKRTAIDWALERIKTLARKEREALQAREQREIEKATKAAEKAAA